MSNRSPQGNQQLGDRHESAQHAAADQHKKQFLEAAFDRSAIMPSQVLWDQSYASLNGGLVQ